MDALALISLIIGVVSLIIGLIGVWYARDAARVGRQALELAKSQADSAPKLQVMLDSKETPFVVQMSKRKPEREQELWWEPGFQQGEVNVADAVIPIKVLNSGSKPANGVTGWLRFSPAFCKPLKGPTVLVITPAGWSLTEDPYVVEIFDKKLTPGTHTTFKIPVEALAPGQCVVSYRLVCDEAVTVEGSLAILIR